MAATERILISKPRLETPMGGPGDSVRETSRDLPLAPGLKIAVRTTTSSLSDYPEWNLDELRDSLRSPDRLITDGACS